MAEWHVRQDGGRPIGPVSTELVIRGIEAGKVSPSAEVCRVGSHDWMPIDMVDEFMNVAVDQDAATRVTESPWFMEHASQPSQPRNAPPPPPVRAKQISSLGLPRAPGPPPPPPVRSSPLASAPRLAPPPPPAQPVSPAQSAYGDVDDEAMTNVAHSPLDAGDDMFEVDDETMTRVAAPRTVAEPLGTAPTKPGLLKTAPMWSGDVPEIRPVRAAAPEPSRPRVPAPRPAAGAPPEASIQVREDLQVHPEPFALPPQMPPAPPGFGAPTPAFPPPQRALDVARFGPTQPAGMGPAPAAYSSAAAQPQQPVYGGQPAPGYGQRPPAVAPHRSDSGVKALIALITLLFLALMAVLILLILRR